MTTEILVFVFMAVAVLAVAEVVIRTMPRDEPWRAEARRYEALVKRVLAMEEALVGTSQDIAASVDALLAQETNNSNAISAIKTIMTGYQTHIADVEAQLKGQSVPDLADAVTKLATIREKMAGDAVALAALANTGDPNITAENVAATPATVGEGVAA